jgi:hypothetical protein
MNFANNYSSDLSSSNNFNNDLNSSGNTGNNCTFNVGVSNKIDHNVIQRKNPQDDYELIQRVGSGTYGEVYKARNIHTNELAAIKVVKLEPGLVKILNINCIFRSMLKNFLNPKRRRLFYSSTRNIYAQRL